MYKKVKCGSMKKIFLCIFSCCLILVFGITKPSAKIIDTMEVGNIYSDTSITNLDDFFEVYDIVENDEIYNRIYGRSFPVDGSVDLKSIKYLKMLYRNFDGYTVVGEMIVHTNLANDVIKAFKQIYESDIEIESMQLIDDFFPTTNVSNPAQVADENSMKANNTSAFNYRKIAGSSSLSLHSLGMAIDVNPFYNPYVLRDGTSPYSNDKKYIDATERENSTDPHVIKKSSSIYKIFTDLGFSWGGDWTSPKDYQHFEKQVSTSVNVTPPQPSNRNLKTILLVAGHGLGKDCNHASANINGVSYYETIETRKLIDQIASFLKSDGIHYEIANEIVEDAYWSSDAVTRNAARSCANPNNSNCCGYKTSTIGTYSPILLQHVDQKGTGTYSLVLEVHFNASGGKYSLVLGRDDNTRSNGMKLAQAVVDAVGYSQGYAEFGIDTQFLGYRLGTITEFYQTRSIPTYYLETVFMDNQEQFQKYLENQEEVARAIADTLIELAPDSRGGSSGGNTGNNESTNPGRTVDPFPNIFGNLGLSTFDDIGCDTYFFDEFGNETPFKEMLDDVFSFIRILVPVVVVILTTIDYIGAILSSDDSKIKKANQKALKRFTIGIILFFLPYLLDLLFHLFGLYDLSRCGIGG